MDRISLAASAATAVACLVVAQAAHGACQLQTVAELPVVVEHNQAFVPASINGQPVRFLVDTGASKTLIWRGAAEGLGLRVVSLEGLKFYGVGGGEEAKITTVRELKLGASSARDIRMIVVGGSGAVRSPRFVGLLGADLLLENDLEIDLPGSVIRLIRAKGCQGDEVVYWNKAYSLAAFAPTDSDRAIYVGASLNGKSIAAQLDSGATRSIVTLRAAERAGVTPRSENVRPDGRVAGVGEELVKTYVAVFPTLSIGDETIQNARLELGDIFSNSRQAPIGSRIASEQVVDSPDMLLGADFMKAHRIYISRAQRKIYFSFMGGTIFDARTAAAPK